LSKTYRVSGTFRMGARWSHFASEVASDSPAKAREKILSDYGSRHHLLRRYINIEKVEEVKADEGGRAH
jgi:large subunit ribosomal protein LX